MPHSFASRIASIVALLLFGPVAWADGPRAAVLLETGEFFLWTEGPTNYNITSYLITSPSDQVLFGNWVSIAGNYDASAGGPVDTDDDWTIIGATSSALFEGEFTGNGGLLQPDAAISLGTIWSTAASRDLTISVTEGNTTTESLDITYILPGDYDADEDVDTDDYDIWRAGFGSTDATFVNGDGNGDGVVDGADFTVWQDNLGRSSSLPSLDLVSRPVAVPEPASGLIASLAVGVAVLARLRRRQSNN